MKFKVSISQFLRLFKEKANPFLRENKKIIIQFIFTLFFFAIGIWFIQHERSELVQVKDVLHSAKWEWVLVGILLTHRLYFAPRFNVCVCFCFNKT